ncbi:bifunctional molybdenum cofactor biosynthesis protein MoaC/MoaB [Parapedobacter pyrenivorans]|uniref:Molybdopterin adenylyltransferase n=1 Tax=Parapedobacter pyrenivorans TaxID=1305674 RepID=A0A917M396_9SPHI|nr:bifunctional molybdenum cofactor biosynthesis protein MoaC/MoaB [Parapedobacter pyrenivorans]GGG74956.1 bifunctional molybdenum cofactor biosynthesis protein MoaC/MoaB [Parapedobacter pyrenivorans]
MVDITHKVTSLRQAVATATVSVSTPETIDAVKDRRVPKGDVFEFSRAAGLLAIKKTSDVIPDCHPLPIEFASITYEIADMTITVRVEVHTIYKTGVEVEAMHGASITALTMYDMLKPIDPNVEISAIKLERKSGGKSTYVQHVSPQLRCAVVVCSDSVADGKKQDTAGKAVIEQLRRYHLDTASYVIIPDDVVLIQEHARRLSGEGYDLLVFTGGTGLSPRDVTPDAIAPLLDREIPGVMEAARSYGQERTPYAMLSRGVAGFMGNTLVLTLPGSTRGAVETMGALFPYITHVFRVAGGMRHDHG